MKWMVVLGILALAPACGPGGKTPRPTPAVNPCPSPTPQIGKLVADLDVAPDPAHADQTPAVHALIGEGLAGACGVAILLVARDADTRLHAQRVVEGVLNGENGWRAGRGYPDEYSEEHVREVLAAIDYAHDSPEPARQAGAARWRQWIEGSHAAPVPPSDGPTPEAMRAALDRVKHQLLMCGEPVDLTVTFAGSGYITAIAGTASTSTMYRNCLRAASTGVHVSAFARSSVWTRYP